LEQEEATLGASEHTAPSGEPASQSVTTRRGFLTRTGKRAAFVLPAVWSLSAQQAAAASGMSCSAYGAHCEVNEDCCSLNCHAPTMTCKGEL